MNPSAQLRPWSGPSDKTRTLRTDYFIPTDLQGDFGRVREVLTPMLTQERMERFIQISAQRTRGVMPVFESTHHCHNISAVLRTAEAMSFQDVSFVYQRPDMKFKISDSVERGSGDWLSVRRTTSIANCIRALKSSNYKIFLISLPSFARTSSHYLRHLPQFATHEMSSPAFLKAIGDQRIAVISGNEKFGISEEWTEFADGYLHVEMRGFVESLNVSVCAGIVLQALRSQWLPNTKSHNLNSEEQALLVEHWIARTCQNARSIIERHDPKLIPWFEFVRGGKFYNLFES